MIVHDDDLVVATHGHSFWVLDDISPLRQAAAPIVAEEAHLFTPRTAWRTRTGHFNPRRNPVGENPPNGAILYYYLKEEQKQPAKLEILDVQGKVQTRSFEVKMDPRVKTSAEDLRKQFDLLLKMRDRQDEMNKTIVAIRDLRGQLQTLEKRLGPAQASQGDANDPPNPVVMAST